MVLFTAPQKWTERTLGSFGGNLPQWFTNLGMPITHRAGQHRGPSVGDSGRAWCSSKAKPRVAEGQLAICSLSRLVWSLLAALSCAEWHHHTGDITWEEADFALEKPVL